MLSIGWTEMMLVAAIALIVVGPKDLPAMLRQIGKAVGKVRRMGNEFKAELNKVAAIDEIKDIKSSISDPLSLTKQKIEEEFNSIAPDGSVVPSGKIAPADPGAQSVVDEIRQGAGLKPLPADKANAARQSMKGAVTKAVEQNKKAANDVLDETHLAENHLDEKQINPAQANKSAKKTAARKTGAAKKPRTQAKKPGGAKSKARAISGAGAKAKVTPKNPVSTAKTSAGAKPASGTKSIKSEAG